MNYARIFKLCFKSVLKFTVRQRYQSVCVALFYSFKRECLNLLINSSQAWNVNFNNGNDNYNNKSNKKYVRCVRGG